MTSLGRFTGACRILQAAIFIFALWIPQPASAQWGNSIFGPPIPPGSIPSVPTPPAVSLAPPGGGVTNPGPNAPTSALAPSNATPVQTAPAIPPGQVPLLLAARFGPEPPGITAGLVWRIYSDTPDQN